jgi:hypothetical protein
MSQADAASIHRLLTPFGRRTVGRLGDQVPTVVVAWPNGDIGGDGLDLHFLMSPSLRSCVVTFRAALRCVVFLT